MKTKKLILLGILSVVALGVVGCSGDSSSSNPTGKIEFPKAAADAKANSGKSAGQQATPMMAPTGTQTGIPK